jgi:hypothetical protein
MIRVLLVGYVVIILMYTLLDDHQVFTVIILLALGLIVAAKITLRLFNALSAVASFTQTVYLFFICSAVQLVLQVTQLDSLPRERGFDSFQFLAMLPLCACILSYFKHIIYSNHLYYPPATVQETLTVPTQTVNTVNHEAPKLFEILNEIVTFPMSHYA